MSVSKQLCARGECCGREYCSASATKGYPRESCMKDWRTRKNMGGGEEYIVDGLRGRELSGVWHH